ncbi:MAG: xanthine phosphoribosyltransferase [Erysipelotrichaceae bacterium]|nr:xanthine phosphoribosyltransferase [Erysipelotrichaceae bacterium]
MKELEQIILERGTILPGDILKIDSFLNHQIDVKVLDMIGEEFYKIFKDSNPDKIMTIEASGIAIATAASRYFGSIPVLFAKKTYALNMSANTYQSHEHSYTRDIDYNVQVSKDYLHEGERILILDDFLANGEAMNSMIDICNQAGAIIVGCGSVVGKSYQPGIQRIKDMGYHVECLASVKSMSDDSIEFE